MHVFEGGGGTDLQQILQLRFLISVSELIYQRYFNLTLQSIIGATEKRRSGGVSMHSPYRDPDERSNPCPLRCAVHGATLAKIRAEGMPHECATSAEGSGTEAIREPDR